MVVLGFGSTETAEEARIIAACGAAISEGRSVDSVLNELNRAANRYDDLPRGEAPQRYTRAYHFDDALHFHHINREHPFSPDGWALLQVEVPYPVKGGSDDASERAVA